MSEHTLKEYEPLWGSWFVGELLGKGSHGHVYKIYKDVIGTTYISAVKHITFSNIDQIKALQMSTNGMSIDAIDELSEDMLHTFQKEIDILYSLKGNSNIVSHEDHEIIKRPDGTGWDILIRMEYLQTLKDYLIDKDVTVEEIVALGIDMCSALQTSHAKGVLHRDIKEENIFVSHDGHFKLGDFGVARTITENEKASTRVGTPLLMAPEVFMGEEYHQAADLYLLGLVLYKLLNDNQIPFIPAAPAKIRLSDIERAQMSRLKGEALLPPRQADTGMIEIILKACAYKPERRYESATEFKHALEQYSTSLPASERKRIILSREIHRQVQGQGVNDTVKLPDSVVSAMETVFMNTIVQSTENDASVEESWGSYVEEEVVNQIEQARSLEKEGYLEGALDIYLSIIDLLPPDNEHRAEVVAAISMLKQTISSGAPKEETIDTEAENHIESHTGVSNGAAPRYLLKTKIAILSFISLLIIAGIGYSAFAIHKKGKSAANPIAAATTPMKIADISIVPSPTTAVNEQPADQPSSTATPIPEKAGEPIAATNSAHNASTKPTEINKEEYTTDTKSVVPSPVRNSKEKVISSPVQDSSDSNGNPSSTTVVEQIQPQVQQPPEPVPVQSMAPQNEREDKPKVEPPVQSKPELSLINNKSVLINGKTSDVQIDGESIVFSFIETSTSSLSFIVPQQSKATNFKATAEIVGATKEDSVIITVTSGDNTFPPEVLNQQYKTTHLEINTGSSISTLKIQIVNKGDKSIKLILKYPKIL